MCIIIKIMYFIEGNIILVSLARSRLKNLIGLIFGRLMIIVDVEIAKNSRPPKDAKRYGAAGEVLLMSI